MNDPQVARIITGAFQYFAGQRYEFHAFCVMPNHVHLLIRALLKSYDEYYHMADIVQSLKSFTSRKINNHLGRKGQVWDHFYFDRVVSDLSSYENVVQYIMINPVKAKLVRNIEDWKYSFFDPKYLKKL